MPFNPEKFIPSAEAEIRSLVGKQKAIIALSGGVDSFVAATLCAKAGVNLQAVFVDTGFMRKGEAEKVKAAAETEGINLRMVDAQRIFIDSLKGVEEPEKKRKIVGELFVRAFEKEAKSSGATFLVQGTIAPDWIESGGLGRDTIKSHHNVAGLPKDIGLKLCEPIRELYKHEVRMVGRTLGLPSYIYERQPFPGPGLSVRIVGEVSEEKLNIVREACDIVEHELEKASAEGKMEKPWQYFAALLPSKTVGVKGDERSYKYTIVVRAVKSLDGMTANFSHVPPEVLQTISTRMCNEIREVGRVVYDITNKPPSTIELE
ncbi:MAG: glutamine-hydrolyzing GMP synthase [Candidatus ainarchaeum sp.]|nr:glutamine-hydrolyzing GMP synthase [Candidatus ainarchaeum sp.]